jgi:hypothetical protein
MPGRVLSFDVARQVPPLAAPAQRNFIMTAGEEVRILLRVYEEDGAPEPLNLLGMSAFFRVSFGRSAWIMRDATFLDLAAGTLCFDFAAGDTFDRFGQAWWRCNLGPEGRNAVIASGAINILPAEGYRTTVDTDLVTPAANPYDAYTGDLSIPQGKFHG